jgi:alkanesulfonate monooxygenase SsuD/methylene tetrahydromethanopterin reductase-like flavin-dependent oxidoreductase (luciferase family)
MLALTGARADGWLPTAHGAAPYGEALASVRAAEAASGRAPGSVVAGAFVWMVVAESRERGLRLLHDDRLRALGLLLPKGALRHTPLPEGPFGTLVPTDPRTGDLAAAIDVEELAEVIPVGAPDDVAAEVRRYIAAGAEHVVLCDMAPAAGADTGLGLRPLEVHAAVRDRVVG